MLPSPRNNPDFNSHEWQDWFFQMWQQAQTFTQVNTPAAGFTYTCPNGYRIVQVMLTPAGVLATGTLVFPTTPQNGDSVLVVSTQNVTALTNTVPTGITLTGAATALTANVGVQYVFSGSNWFRVR